MARLEEICRLNAIWAVDVYFESRISTLQGDQRHANLYSYLAKRAQQLRAAGEDVVFRLTYLVLRLEQVMGNVLILCDKAPCDFSLPPIYMLVLNSSWN